MRRKSKYVVLSLVLCLSMMLFLCGCGEEKSGSTIEEPEITGKYLQEDYSQQLLNDGAETVVGYVTLDKLGEGDYSVHISERQVVASSEYKDGYYIADNNVAKDVTEFARLNDDILFGEVWSRNNLLSLRDRSIVTVVALMSQGLTDSSFKYHLESAKKNGVTRTEIAEILTHAAFYAGWPKAWAAFRMAKEVWTGGNADSVAAGSLEAYAQTIIFPVGKPNDAYAKYFIGQSYTAPVVTDGVPVVNVTFEPGCRNNWHVHKATKGGGQTLVCVGGRGYYQEWGKEPVELHSGDAINIPAGVKHWHGAAPDSWFSHLAIEVPGENNSTEWLEPVGDEEYAKLK